MLTRIRKSMEQRDKGFTLIELLVVIIIIGILAAIAIPVFLNQRKKGWNAAAESDLRNLAVAEEAYNTENPGTGYTDVTADLAGSGYVKSDGVNVTVHTDTAVPATDYCASAVGGGGAGDTFFVTPTSGGVKMVDAAATPPVTLPTLCG